MPPKTNKPVNPAQFWAKPPETQQQEEAMQQVADRHADFLKHEDEEAQESDDEEEGSQEGSDDEEGSDEEAQEGSDDEEAQEGSDDEDIDDKDQETQEGTCLHCKAHVSIYVRGPWKGACGAKCKYDAAQEKRKLTIAKERALQARLNKCGPATGYHLFLKENPVEGDTPQERAQAASEAWAACLNKDSFITRAYANKLDRAKILAKDGCWQSQEFLDKHARSLCGPTTARGVYQDRVKKGELANPAGPTTARGVAGDKDYASMTEAQKQRCQVTAKRNRDKLTRAFHQTPARM